MIKSEHLTSYQAMEAHRCWKHRQVNSTAKRMSTMKWHSCLGLNRRALRWTVLLPTERPTASDNTTAALALRYPRRPDQGRGLVARATIKRNNVRKKVKNLRIFLCRKTLIGPGRSNPHIDHAHLKSSKKSQEREGASQSLHRNRSEFLEAMNERSKGMQQCFWAASVDHKATDTGSRSPHMINHCQHRKFCRGANEGMYNDRVILKSSAKLLFE